MGHINKKVKALIIVVIALAFVANLVTIKNKYISIVCLGVIFVLLIGLFDEKKEPEEDDGEDEEDVASDEEMEAELLSKGEYSYDNYDKVCCEECGAYLGEGVDVCPECGHVRAGSEEAEKTKVCPNCGKPIEDDVGFCTYCNYEFKK